MKRIISLGLMMTLLATILCACGTKVMDVTIEGGAESATLAIEKYYTAMSSLDFDTLLEVSASLNKTCVQNTVAKYDEEKYNTGIETMKTELQKDMGNVSIVASVSEENIYDNTSDEYKTFVEEYKEVCAGINKAKNYAKVKTTLTYTEGEFTFTEEKEINCIEIQDKWFVFDYSSNATEADEETTKKIEIVGGGDSIEDVVAKYFGAISQKNADNLADVLVTMNATATQAIGNGYDEAQHQTALEAMRSELASDPDNATLTPTVSSSNTYETGSEELNSFVTTHANILKDSSRISAYADAVVSLSISVPGESETFSATENITCLKIDNSWFIINTEE